MTDSSEKHNGWLNFELQSPHVIEMRSNAGNQACNWGRGVGVEGEEQLLAILGWDHDANQVCYS